MNAAPSIIRFRSAMLLALSGLLGACAGAANTAKPAAVVRAPEGEVLAAGGRALSAAGFKCEVQDQVNVCIRGEDRIALVVDNGLGVPRLEILRIFNWKPDETACDKHASKLVQILASEPPFTFICSKERLLFMTSLYLGELGFTSADIQSAAEILLSSSTQALRQSDLVKFLE